MRSGSHIPALAISLILSIPVLVLLAGCQPAPATRLDLPAGVSPDWLVSQAQAQRATSGTLGVFHDFTLTDRLPESGIGFVGHVVEDASKTFKSAHYDHGTGLALADVDGDGLVDLYFVNQIGPSELWRNLGGGRFEDVTEQAGVALPDRVGVSASFADIDNDGDADLFATTVRGGNALFENDGTGRFTDISAASGLDYVGHSSAGVFFDYDRDGLVDLFLANVGVYTNDTRRTTASGVEGLGLGPDGLAFYEALETGFSGHLVPERTERSLLYRNAGGNRFEDVTDAVGLGGEGWSGDATPMDGDNDGWPDLYVLNMQGKDEYYENDAGRRFVARGEELFPKTPWGAMGIKVFDFDNDGLLDVYVTDMHSDMSQDVPPSVAAEKAKADIQFPESFLATGGASLFGNAFYRKEGSDRYVEVSDEIGAETYWPWGLSVGDLNADGYEDAFVTAGMSYPYRYGINSVLLNDRGERFADSEFILGVEPRQDGRFAMPWFEIDCSGADREHADCEGRTSRFEVWGARSTRSSAMVDLENDGDLDIVTNEHNAAPMVLVSDLTEVKPEVRFLVVRLVGTESNRGGLGARVTVSAGGRTYVQANDGKSGYLSQSALPLYFGLGEAETVDRVEVDWPSGTHQVVDGPIEAGTRLEVEEAGG